MAKKKDVVEIIAENIFKDAKFQEKWQGYLIRFGADIDNLFSDSYKAKVNLASVLQKICDGNYEEALEYLKVYIPSCSTDEKKHTLNRLITECEKNILPKTHPKQSERYMQYRDKLLSAGFSEAKQHCGHFFRQATEKTAFVINLDDEEHGVSVMYGFASTAFMAGDEEWFANNGSDKNSCQVRNILSVCDERDETKVAEIISAFYMQYKDYSKDEILALKKERQKAFLDHFTPALKPLGFKKKGTKWTKDLCNGTALSFEAQKSAFSDEYYFNISIHDISDFYARKTYDRVVMHDSQIYNWQLMSEDQIENLIQYTLTKHIKPKIEQ